MLISAGYLTRLLDEDLGGGWAGLVVTGNNAHAGLVIIWGELSIPVSNRNTEDVK